MYDCHIHTNFSLDSTANIEDVIKKAISINLKGIAITDHIDIDDNGNVMLNNSFEKINNQIILLQNLKEKYKKEIELLVAFEVGANNSNKAIDVVQKTLNMKELDFNILSTHEVDGKHCVRIFNDNKIESYSKYFDSILTSVKTFENFCVYGHLDYITRYSKYEKNDVEIKDYKNLIDEILKTIISKDAGLEVNTSGIKYGREDFYPQKDILKRYKELGGKILTIGSDAHKVHRVGDEFEFAKQYIKDCGFNEVAYFKERKPVFYKI